jgi:hypothetical protein
MKEKYFIGDFNMREAVRKEISADRYKELERCYRVVHGAIDIEHKYALLLDDFKELEVDLVRFALEHVLHSRGKPTHFAEERLNLDRRILNVLAASRAYTDQTHTTISGVYGRDSKEYRAFTKAINDMRTSDVEYVFGYGLRDYVQHQGMPTYIGGVNYAVVQRAPPIQIACTIQAKIKKELLLKGTRVPLQFKKVVTSMPDEIDLKPRIRGFVRSLSNLHLAMRKVNADAIATAVDLWKGVRSECKVLGCGKFVSALATPSDDPSIVLRYLAFTDEALKHLGEVQEYNSSPRKIGDCFITSQDEDKMLRNLR